MKITLASGLTALIICLMSSGLGHAQSAGPPTPTTRILAIGTVTPVSIQQQHARSCRRKSERL
jgi:hypothetical protein